jgi:hypothetical protein
VAGLQLHVKVVIFCVCSRSLCAIRESLVSVFPKINTIQELESYNQKANFDYLVQNLKKEEILAAKMSKFLLVINFIF